MHILWINEVANFTGGAERYILDTMRLLKEKTDARMTLLYGVPGWTEPAFTSAFDVAFPMVDLPRQVAEEQPDIIYVNRLNGRNELLQLIQTGVPVVRFFHDHKLFCLREHKYRTLGSVTCRQPIGMRCYPCLGFINRADKWPGIRFTSLAAFRREQAVNKQLAAIVVGSEYMKQHIVAHGFDAEKIKVNPLYSLSPLLTQPDFDSRDIFLFVGQLVRGKGVDVLLHAYAALDNAPPLVICGSGRQQEEFRHLAASLGVQAQVQWAGRIPQEELAAYYKRAQAVIMPSRVPETFGLAGLEAMAYQVPVIATEVGGISQWLQHGRTGLAVPPNDAAALQQAMQKLIDAPALRAALGAQAGMNFTREFGPQRHIAALAQLFETLTGRR
jgi:glycosyltransferase involved in cell wall biosynthesis